MFAASDMEEEKQVLEAKLPTYPKYRRVPAVRMIEDALLLPTFGSPDWTMLFRRPGEPGADERSVLARFLDLLGEPLDNPVYRPRTTRR